MILQRLSLYSSTGNHTIAEAAGLVYAGLLFPEMDMADTCYSTGVSILEQEADKQILPDGGGAERSSWYHVLVLDLYGLVASALAKQKRGVPAAIGSALERGRSFIGGLSNSVSSLPRCNDADDGVALSHRLRISWPDSASSDILRTFPDTGLSIVRWGENCGSYLTLDHGPLG